MTPPHTLPGRAALLDELATRLSADDAALGQVSLVVISLDSFRQVKEGLGRDVGDLVLAEIGARLGLLGSPTTSVFRVDGDEFAVVCPRIDGDEALAFGERLLAVVRRPIQLPSRTLRLSASVGVTTAPAGITPTDLLREADATTSSARSRGAGSVAVFRPVILATAENRLEVTADLAEALDFESGLLLHYQPVYDLGTGAIVGAEALVRWQHPEHGMVSPDSFISIAEDTGLICGLGSWVLDTAVGQLAEWMPLIGEDFRMHVNLSPVETWHPGFLDRVVASLDRHGMPPSMLLLEITETGLMTSAPEPMSLLNDLKRVGVDLGIDDFGTGYSSISYLRELPVDVVKLDRSITSGVATSPAEYDLARSVFGLMRAAGLKVIAEGIETAVQVAHLRALECRYGQGFHLARPTSAEQVTAMLKA